LELSLKEAAEALGISLTTARRWVKAGRLRALIREGPYGPEYIVTQEELERAKRENPAPVTVVLPDPKDQQGVTVPKEWLAQAMRQALEEALANTLTQMTRDMEDTLATLVKGAEETLFKQWTGVEEGLKEELEALRQELAATRETQERIERSIEERDKRLIEALRGLTEKRRPWWRRLLRRER